MDDADDNDEDAAPKTRKELYDYYSGVGPASMVLDFHEDQEFQRNMIIIPYLANPLHHAYSAQLSLLENLKGQLLFCAERATLKPATKTALAVLRRATRDELFLRLGMTLGGLQPQQNERTEDYLKADRKLMDTIYKFAFALAGETLWTHARYYWCLPHALACYLLQSQHDREESCMHLTRIVEAILRAEAEVDPSTALRQCLRDCSFFKEQLPRIIMHHCYNHDGLGPNDKNMMLLAWKLFAGTSSTKENLESCFNYMQRQSGKPAPT